ncbi:MAG: nitronate monooxygenase [Promethearchaeota archaeon]|jgi:NAD(P)H-dependent flavin oxidoreductase YrpB (nitropropane dioxygenase family)
MKKKNDILDILKNKIPIWGFSPKGITIPSLSTKISQIGGVGLVDLEGLNSKQCLTLLKKCYSSLSSDHVWGIRVVSKEILNSLEFQSMIPIIICAFSPDSQDIAKLKKNSNLLLSEVSYLEEAYKNAEWADIFLVKGSEAGGMVGVKNSFILIQEFNKAGLSFVIQGGFGVFNICSALIGGALAVILESQLYLLPECPLIPEFKEYIKTIEESDFYTFKETSRFNYRLIGKLANKSIRSIREIEKEELSDLGEEFNGELGEIKEKFSKKINEFTKNYPLYSDNNPKHSWLPSDQGICFANFILDSFGTVENFFDKVLKIIQNQLKAVKKYWPFAKNSDFAQLLNITYPIIQGPMANISDQLAFATKIAENGALPILALGGLLENEASTLLSKASSDRLSEMSYGSGIIGLEVVKSRREKHLESISKYGPKITLIAAGSIDLGVQVKKLGSTVLIHTPALSMFKDALKKHLNFMILEGSECGGHFGMLSSFILWERILEYLYMNKKEIKEKVNLIFAGGIINDVSTAMLAGMIGEHFDLINPGIQMGTAYLLSEEIVNTQALSPIYQELLLNNSCTTVIGTSVNTRARVIPTEFAFKTIKDEYLRKSQGISISERKEIFEKENLGALRIASRAEVWNDNHIEDSGTTQFIPTSSKNQLTNGAFMTGESISLQKSLRNIDQIHYDIIEEGKKSFEIYYSQHFNENMSMKEENKMEKEFAFGKKIAIIGLGGIFPDAENIPQFWANIKKKKYSITEALSRT